MRNQLLALAATLVLSGCVPWGQIACVPSHDALLILGDIAAGAGDSELKRTTPAPVKTAVTYAVEGRKGGADVYVSGTPQAGIVLTPGASTSGKDDPRLVAFAESFARSGFAVVVPDLPNVRALKVSPDDARGIADAFVYASGRPELSPQGRLGFGAFSYALGPTILGALQADVKDKARFILGVGGYYDLNRVITYFTTGAYRATPNEPWQHNTPNNYGRWAFVLGNADHFADKQVLTDMAYKKLADPSANVDDLAAKITGADGKALYAILTNTDPDKVPGLIAALPQSVRDELDQLNLANKDLTGLKARVILFHGYEDDLVPYTESPDLAKAIGGRTRLFLVHGLVHVDYAQPGFFDGWSFGCAIQDVLNEKWKSALDG